MPVTLEQILDSTRNRVEAAKRAHPLDAMIEAAARHRPRGFIKSLELAAQHGVAVIAELKKASPSKGVLRGTLHIGRLAAQSQQAGAAALSVLTEEEFFHGSLGNLREASAACDLPCLRKDFIVDEYQLFEAKANSADAVLLIAAALPEELYGMLYRKARELGLDVLCEVHNEAELARTIVLGAEMVGVNSRDLRTLEMFPDTLARLAPHLPKNVMRVAESGIKTGAEIRELRGIGYRAFLIGETLMRAEDPSIRLAQLLGEGKAPAGTVGWSTAR